MADPVEEEVIDRRKNLLIGELERRLKLMIEDYTHNLSVTRSRDAEIANLQEQNAGLAQRVRSVEGKLLAQRNAAEVAERQAQDTSHSCKIQLEQASSRLSALAQEKAIASLTADEKEAEIIRLKEQLAHLATKHVGEMDEARRNARLECDQETASQQRLFAQRESQLRAECRRLETRHAEVGEELQRVRESAEEADRRREDIHKQLLRREATIAELQQRLSDQERMYMSRVADAEADVAACRAAKQQTEIATNSQTSMLARDYEKKCREVEALHEKMNQLREEHDADVKRRTQQHDICKADLEERLRESFEKLRTCESKCTSAEDAAERTKRALSELRTRYEAAITDMALLKEKNDEMQRAVHRKEVELEKQTTDVRRMVTEISLKEKELQAAKREVSMIPPGPDFSSRLSGASPARGAAAAAAANTLSFGGPSGMSLGPTGEPSDAALGILLDIRRQLHSGGGGTHGAAPQRSMYALQQEIQRLKEASVDQQIEMKHRLDTALRTVDRERRSRERWGHQPEWEASPSVPTANRTAASDTVGGDISGASPVPPGPPHISGMSPEMQQLLRTRRELSVPIGQPPRPRPSQPQASTGAARSRSREKRPSQ